MNGNRRDIVKPIVVLTLICLVVSAALAFTNSLTKPVIDEAAAKRSDEIRLAVMPEADAFEQIEVPGMPETVSAAYRAKNGAGYVFNVVGRGYGGDMQIICGIGPDGRITACMTLSHSETEGVGSKTAEEEYRGQYAGKDASLEGVEAISRATVSSEAYEKAIRDVFEAYEAAKEAGR
ncbi:MAG: Electron transport complex protein RnfG [Firmicutes bacterium ADurb.Bin248]|jgi:electron transport complex protein RnfG|nr:MAG: Electron transport complex protein RnfG [Firmicutes bacterium ADurb.Bin248]HOG01637.1 FMN-binding protein [Clostridia bacterium]HPK14884.1 FMN-binding protein [Clostridia bacterium]